ncbi:MAG TPA: alpha/beta fold hydrolase [Thermoleophilaceae bacterium]|nr:alpha/beta fold hydrolase [Thermoleophilaceae bacterium]
MRATRAGLAFGAAASLLLANRAAAWREERPARAGVGRLVPTAAGDLHVLEEGDPAAPPAVLLHGFAGSMHWFDRLAPLLGAEHRLVRIDLLGHGGSAKPRGDYSIERHAEAVAGALGEIGVASALFLGHSFGGAVSIAVAERSPALVERLVVLDEGPDNSYGDLSLITRLGFMPVVGELVHRVSFDAAIRDGYGDAFGEDFDLSGELGDQVVRDFRAMTFPSYKCSWDAEERYLSATQLHERVRQLGLPALVVFGEQDRFFDAESSAAAFRTVPGVRVEVLPGVGHSPNVERPDELARLVREHVAAPA